MAKEKEQQPSDYIADGKIDVRELAAALDFEAEGTAPAILNQSKLLLQASYYRVQKLRARMKAESDLNQAQVAAATTVRTSDAGDRVKITEAYVREQTESDPKVIGCQKAFDEAKVLEEWAKLLLDSFHMRGTMLKALVQLLGAEAAVESGFVKQEMERMGVDRLREKVLSRYPARTK